MSVEVRVAVPVEAPVSCVPLLVRRVQFADMCYVARALHCLTTPQSSVNFSFTLDYGKPQASPRMPSKISQL